MFLRFCQISHYILGVSWTYLGDILGIFWVFWHILGVFSLGIVLALVAHLGHIFGISWVYLGHILGISWAYVGLILGLS